MHYILSDHKAAIAALSNKLRQELTSGKRVLWLVSGGSNIQAAKTIMDTIPEDVSALLTITLIDERFGMVGHKDSNWQQLLDAGLEGKHAELLPVLHDGMDFEQTRDAYEALLTDALAANDMSMGLLSIGPDGHIAGILPHSPAADENQQLVSGYEAPPHRRLTATFPMLARLSAIYVFAFGENKRPTLEQLQKQNLPVQEQPAQFLKQLPEVYLYNDQVGEEP